ncbi:Heat shock protein STI1 [Symbiodinium microadriaticum]|uniref:Heat shock protein STI1 n=1 Tax=Symbiodinium microadriaticum TaxID=2951 RepID=A0A1Q9DV71_SYMMI|nr:Heat shock protein STI1 [Symbiodinium microadriaticum]
MAEADRLRQQGNAEVKIGRLRQHAYLGSGREAIELYTQALESMETQTGCREHAIILGNRCQCYMRLGRYRDASADAERAVEVDPSYAKGLYRLAVCQKELCDLAGAWESATREPEHDQEQCQDKKKTKNKYKYK